MCILCVVQRWSRRVASMLPYLVIPLMLLWALSHFLPPGFRFEATSPRIACAAVLLMTLLWYEFLLPRLSAWRARRSARLRELRREQALELQKLRKTATRRCRNCLSPYRDQNPGGGGRFMCSNCGHVSKRPVLELPGHAGNFGEKGGWFCSQFLSSETGNGYWLEDSNNNSNNNSAQENAFPLGCKIGKILSFFCLVFKWVCRRVFGFGSSGENGSSDNDSKRNKRGENGGNLQESKTDKARRKAEEKRLARLEKEMLEEEERKQREEVARLVEERRKLRDEKLEAEEKSKGVTPIGEREGKKEHDKKRQERERRRESNNQKDKMSNKSNSDCEEFEKKGRNVGTSHGTSKASHQQNGGGNNNNINNRRKYFGGNFRGFTGASFFGGSNQASNAASNTTSVNKGVNKTSLNAASSNINNSNQSHVVKREGHTGTGTVHNAVPNGDDKNAETKINRPVQTDQQPPQQPPPPKKAWHQLFKRSLPVSVSPSPTPQPLNPQTLNPQTLIPQTLNPNIDTYIAPPNNYFNPQRPAFKPQSLLPFPVYNPIITTNPNPNPNPNLSFHQSSTSLIFPPVRQPSPVPRSPPVESESFEDPDALSLLGNLPLGFIPPKMTKPSPIESPIARPKSNNNSNDRVVRDGPGAWTLWGAPLTQNALGSVGGGKSGEYLMSSSRHLMSDKRAVAPPDRTAGKAADPNGESLFLPHNLMGRQLDGAKSPDISPTHHWSKKEWMVNGEATSSIPASPRGESLFSADPVVQSLWSFNQKDSK
ncbi:hypothetical protein LUZ60_011371 [Juncus effusus]|nr:hypothetical protein LUZ60_011371 [Juncus effusus]